ncbi:MAG: mercuric ion transporter MerT [Hydrogenophaga sp.]|jgi:mercuric ion transport protein|uniref:mercuric ion transporter MerT n=1 Tax=Hydrogenophaga sp. TaxID=1904254 RepID=UPI001D5C2214|nr:mercuric ion transporter MerT [Hydrogenophaga sp.]MBW0170218.1 mercuric ion transporter MerT [Hydrogenophaga sp.]MBW0182376.1 mercuric ion transporter MerT [Hydrogenophaga sp.]
MPPHTTTPNTPTFGPATEHGGKALLAGGLAAHFASACCLGPLVLIMVGISGAWISHLTALEPYQPLFMGASLAALFFAARSIWRPAPACEPGQVCAIPRVNRTYKLLFGVVVLLLATAMAFPLIAHWFY